ncbi:hypothetical protein N9N67_00170 [Bacteriovoracaceae bacterium]|nr:hypothetical protein [Bacteriovoracaceae bacterium]
MLGAENSYNNEIYQKQQLLFQEVIYSTNNITSSLLTNQLCLQNNPSIMSSIANLSGSIGSAATISNPLLSMAVSASTDLITDILDSVRKTKYYRKIRRLGQSTLMLEGLKCGLHTLANRWCTMDDAQSIVQEKINLKYNDSLVEELSELNLLQYEIPAYLDWLNKIRAGVRAATSSDADRQRQVIFREASIRSSDIRYNAILIEFREQYNKTKDIRDRWNILRGIVIDISQSSECGEPNITNPLHRIYGACYAPYYLLGITEAEVPRANGSIIQFSQFDPFSQWPRNGETYTPNYDLIKTQLDNWITRARNDVNTLLSIRLQPDAINIISQAFDPISTDLKINPKEALEKIIKYLKDNPIGSIQKGAFNQVHKSTLNGLVKISKSIDKLLIEMKDHKKHKCEESTANKPHESEEDKANDKPVKTCDQYADEAAQKTLAKIYETSKLEFGTSIIQNRLEVLTRVMLFEKIKNSKDTKNKNIYYNLLAADRFTDVFSFVTGSNSLNRVQSDIMRGKPITQTNLSQFVSLFHKNIKKSLEALMKSEKKAHLDDKEYFRRSRAELCFGLLAAPQWHKKIPRSYCMDMKLKSYFKNGPSTQPISNDLINKSMKEKACVYRDYFRENEIYERWGIK